ITVTNTPGVLTEDTADMTMALILAVARRISEGERLIRSGKWQGWSPMGMLEKKEIAGAGLDVFEHEPAVNPKLLRLDNVVLLPHMGSATIEGRVDMGEKVIINIKTFADGHRPP